MKRLLYFTFFVILASALISCVPAPPTDNTGMLKPGDKIGDMTVEQGSPNSPYPEILEYCKLQPFETEPAVFTIECTVPPVPGLALVIGWGATEAMLTSNWDAMTWEMYIDDYQVDLDKFDWVESDYPFLGPDVKARDWYINLIDPSLGKHTFRYSWSSETPIDDGMDVYQPGTYEQVYNFTVAEP